MSSESPAILIIEDDADVAKAARLLLERQGMSVAVAADPAAAWVQLAERPADVILLDLNFARGRTSGEEGFAMLDRLIAADRHAVVIVVTGHSGIAVAVQAMRQGATDFVIKPWSNERLLATVQRGVALRRAKLDAATAPPVADGLLLGESAAMARIRDLIARVAPTEASVLLRGATGTGKTLSARLLHQGSARADGPFVTLHAETADEATIAAQTAAAFAGTLVIDHVDRLPRGLQTDLGQRIEGIRMIATSRLDRAGLRAAVGEDLLYRIGTIEIEMPPLAAREGDALLLARHYRSVFEHRHGKPACAISDAGATAIAQAGWPDNVRELRLVMERAVLLGADTALGLDDLAPPVDYADGRALQPARSLAQSEQAMIETALKRHAFNVSRAAAELGLTRAALYRRMARYGL
ncbi:response regulator [Sphingomonas sp. CARO-RG-8B-R24-01]|uniref:sigma-54-dependent transcriptional regulator n=1 Tax=Sphingomonas sp. CARO-RG-8B-R24-01 TaxID=2914831 RepID=UPI001F5A2E2A|nr:response regulator [Sphingomonas sp. CARO-RG-8B-R24-01]